MNMLELIQISSVGEGSSAFRILRTSIERSFFVRSSVRCNASQMYNEIVNAAKPQIVNKIDNLLRYIEILLY